jgi:cell fate (sporulation/competence/biofilm development) regulator YlbF (YheA/YmcA/DUF963 family)
MESRHSLFFVSAALSQGSCVSFKMLRLTMDNPFGDGLSSIYRKTSDKPIFVFGNPNKEEDGEPCRILADVQTVRAGMDNVAAKEAIQAAQRFAQRESKKSKPDMEILRALAKTYEKNEHVRSFMSKTDDDIQNELDFVRAMIVSDVSGTLSDEINIMISIKSNASRTTRQGVQAILDSLRRTERSTKSHPRKSTRTRNIFEEDEANQMEAEKSRETDQSPSALTPSSSEIEKITEPSPIFQFGIVPSQEGHDLQSEDVRNSRTPSGDPSRTSVDWNSWSPSRDPSDQQPRSHSGEPSDSSVDSSML